MQHWSVTLFHASAQISSIVIRAENASNFLAVIERQASWVLQTLHSAAKTPFPFSTWYLSSRMGIGKSDTSDLGGEMWLPPLPLLRVCWTPSAKLLTDCPSFVKLCCLAQLCTAEATTLHLEWPRTTTNLQPKCCTAKRMLPMTKSLTTFPATLQAKLSNVDRESS